MPSPLFIDLETRSPVNLKTDGGRKYADHPQTTLLTAVWSVDGVYGVWFPTLYTIPEKVLTAHLPKYAVFFGPDVPQPLLDNLDRPWMAHNAWGFDECVWNARYPNPVEWLDSYPLALQHGLPGDLNSIGERLGVGGKEKAGSTRLKSVTKNYNTIPTLMDIVLIGRYNVHDVVILERLYEHLQSYPKQPQREQKVLRAHRDINARGCRVDLGLMREIRRLTDYAVEEAVQQINTITDGYIPDLDTLNKRNKVISWLESQGVDVWNHNVLGGSIAKDAVSQWVERYITGDADIDELIEAGDFNAKGIKLLQLRSSAMRVTGGKIDAGIAACRNGRIHDLFAYWAAHTGRWGGRRIQVQNLPRPKEGVPVWSLVDLYESTGKLDPDAVRALLSKNATLDDAASGLLRAIFLPEPGHMIAAADYAAIECRVLAWLANEQTLLEQFRNDVCPYSAMAESLFGRPPVNKKDPIRHVGKTIVLGAGYQLGAKKFRTYGEINGIDFDEIGVTPEQCIDAFRSSFPEIAGHVAGEIDGRPYRREGFWHKIDGAAKDAMYGGTSKLGNIVFKYDGEHLRCRLPSGRFLTYRNARIDEVPPAYDPDKLVSAITYLSPRGFRSVLYGGKLTENIDQATSRDIIAEAVVRCEEAGIQTLLHVHDEAVESVPDPLTFDRFMSIMTTPPDWLSDFPLDAEGGVMPRYSKTVRPENAEIVYRNGQYKSGDRSRVWPEK